MKRLIAAVVCLVLILSLSGCGETSVRIGILLSEDSAKDFAWADEEISPTGRKLKIHSCDELGDAEILLKPVEAKEENAYEPVFIGRGQTVTIDVEKHAWFKIGIRMIDNAVPGKEKYLEMKGITVRISSEKEQSVMRGTVLEIGNASMIVQPVEGSSELNSSDKFAVALEHMEASPEPVVGDIVEITYGGGIEETYPAGLEGVTHIKVIREEVIVGGDTCPCVCIDDVMYYDTGKAVPVEPDESAIEYVEIPLGGNGAIGSITAFARLEEGKMIVCRINDEWYEFVVK